MADPHWTGYVGMITGLIGSITGLTGAIMGFISYKKVGQLKSLDLRIELRRAVTDVHSDYNELLEKMVAGNNSRRAVLSGIGHLHSSAMRKWKEEYEADQEASSSLFHDLPAEDHDFDSLSTKELEAALIEIHHKQNKIGALTNKYNEAMAWDDEQRRQLREDIRARDQK